MCQEKDWKAILTMVFLSAEIMFVLFLIFKDFPGVNEIFS